MKLLIVSAALLLHGAAAQAVSIPAMQALEGVYKHRFTSGIITPGKAPMEADTPYQAEDIVEIVRYDDTHLYVRAELQFYNGHSCSIAGMAGHENGKFVFHDPEQAAAGRPSCTLSVSASAGSLIITDRAPPDGEATCMQYCGMRGSLSQVALPLKARRPIRYLKRVVQSRQYRKAIRDLEQYQASRRSQAAGR